MGQNLTVIDHLRSLELGVSANGDDVRKAFRRLARQYHPDLNRTMASNRRFVEVVEAYRALQMELGLRPNIAHFRLCPRCGNHRELLAGVDGREGCPDCLLGLTARRRYLPLPKFVNVKHVGTIALYAASIWFAYFYSELQSPGLAALSLGCALLGLVLLFVACMTIPEVVSGGRGGRRLRNP